MALAQKLFPNQGPKMSVDLYLEKAWICKECISIY